MFDFNQYVIKVIIIDILKKAELLRYKTLKTVWITDLESAT